MSDQKRAVTLSAVLLLAAVVGTVALAGPTVAQGGDATAALAAVQANETRQVGAGETLVMTGTTSLDPAENAIEVTVVSGPSADAFETVTVDEWDEDGQWTAGLPVPEDAEPGSYEVEVAVGGSTTSVQFEVVEQVAADGAANDTAAGDNGTAALGNATTEEDALGNETGQVDNETGLLGGADNETTTEGAMVGNETTTADETAANVTNRTVNGTAVQQVQPGETMTIRGTTSLDPANASVVVEVTDGPSADAFETVTVDEWSEDGVWTAQLQVPEDAEPGSYEARVTAGEFTRTVPFEVVEQVAAQNETTTEEDDGLFGNETTATEEADGLADGNETTTEEDGPVGNETTTEEDGIAGNETTTEAEDETTTEEEAAANETEPAAGEDGAADTTTPGQPGFGVAVALVAAVLSLLVLARRR